MNTTIQLIRNATMKINYAGKTLLTDPLLGDKEAYRGFLYRDRLSNPTVKLPLSIEEITENVDGLLVSHSHIPAEDIPSGPSDHFDEKAVELLNKDLPVYIQSADMTSIKRMGFKQVIPIENSIDLDSIQITRFDGLHADIEACLPLVGEVSGYVMKAKEHPTILWTGDTLLTDTVKEAIALHNPSIIITHSGGAQMPIDEKGTIVKLVMDADDTIEIAKLAPKATIIAIHMEALDHCPVTRAELNEKAVSAGISLERLIIPVDGQTLTF